MDTKEEETIQKSSFVEKFRSWTNKGQIIEEEDFADDNDKEDKKNTKAPEPKKTFAERLGFKKKVEIEEPAATELGSEDVFSRKKKKNKEVNKGKNNKTDNAANNTMDDIVRIKVWVRSTRDGQFKPGKFCECLVDYFAADQRNIYSAQTISFGNVNSLDVPKLDGNLNGTLSSLQLDRDSISPTSPAPSVIFSASGYNTPNLRVPGTANSFRSMRNETISVAVECILQDNRVLIQPAPTDETIQRTHAKMKKNSNRPGAGVSFICVMEVRPYLGNLYSKSSGSNRIIN